ncbi:MAG: amidohydrolase family protein [Chitinophagaceae bacterium]|nr:amidohydrolase family protein [Chitinophagaceae bacterium]
MYQRKTSRITAPVSTLAFRHMFFFLCCSTSSFAQGKSQPIIDMHIHANHANFAGMVPMTLCVFNEEFPATPTGKDWGDTLIAAAKKCKYPLVSEVTDDDVMNRTFDLFRKHNMYGVTSGRLTEVWHKAESRRVIPSFYLRGDGADPSPDSLRNLFTQGRFKVLGEIAVQYNGMAPDDPFLTPYWALAEELDIPVGIHIGPGPIGAPYLGWDKYRAKLHSPLKLEEILVKHPKLRVYIMHAAWPMVNELLALLWTHPQVYLDISGIVTDLSKPAFHSYLEQIVKAGFCNRVLYGSDQMIWPELINKSIEAIESAIFLSKKQKRDIFYNNAARFLKLSQKEIDMHHGK